MQVVSNVDEHLISVQDADTGVLWHFGVGQRTGFRFIGAEPPKAGELAPDEKSARFVPAEATAMDFARRNGWL